MTEDRKNQKQVVIGLMSYLDIVVLTFTSRSFVFAWTGTLKPIIHFSARSSISARIRLAFVFLCYVKRPFRA